MILLTINQRKKQLLQFKIANNFMNVLKKIKQQK